MEIKPKNKRRERGYNTDHKAHNKVGTTRKKASTSIGIKIEIKRSMDLEIKAQTTATQA